MTNEQIEKYITNQKTKDNSVNIYFKDRNMVTGVFIQDGDYSELKSKNLWRIVSGINLEEYRRTRNSGLSRIFNGISFTRLSEVQ